MRGKGREKEKGKTSDEGLGRIPFRVVLPVESTKAADFHLPILESPRKKVNIIAGVMSIFHSRAEDDIWIQCVFLASRPELLLSQLPA